MRKLRKLITNPKLFFSDMSAKKKGGPTAQEKKQIAKAEAISQTTNNSKVTYSPTPVEIVAGIEIKNPKLSLITDRLNLYNSSIVHLIHIGEGISQGPAQLKLWISHFISSGESFAVLIRHRDLYEYIKRQYPFINLIYAQHPNDVEQVLNTLTYLKMIYYLSNTGNLIHTLRYNLYTHVFLGHGDSDKSASAHKFFRAYDEVWVAGQAHIDRFKNADFKTEYMNFIKVGRPALKEVIEHFNSQKKQIEQPKILYLPTWEGVYEENNYSSTALAPVMLAGLQKRYHCDIIAKLHPATGSRKKSLAKTDQTLAKALHKNAPDYYHIAGRDEELSQLIMQANCYICDISAVVSECIAANKPLFVYIPKDREIKSSLSNMNYEDYAYTFSSIQELYELFDQVIIKKRDHLQQVREKAREYLISVDETLNNTFVHALQNARKEERLQENTAVFVNQ